MANQTGGPGSYSGTGNIFDGGVQTGTYTLAGDGLLGIAGNAGAEVLAGTIANITIGLDLGILGIAALTDVSITADTGGTANIGSLVGAVLGTTTLDAAGGAISIANGIAALGTVDATITAGGQFDAYQSLLTALSATSVDFGAGGGNFTIEATGLSINLLSNMLITGFSAGDVIDDQSIGYADLTSYSIAGGAGSNQTVTFFNGTTAEGGLTFAPGTFATTGTFTDGTGPVHVADNNSFLEITTCFLRGTSIATSLGESPVESLQIGDLVATRIRGATVFQPVVWIGHRTMDARAIGGRIEAYPVRIRAGAFADHVPGRDLLVTGDHCIHVDGRLVPARMLINGGSIFADTGIARYEYFHVELQSHAILIAEGLETESYLDTGNRSNFANSAMPSLNPDFGVDAGHKSWEADAAAPLAVDRATVEPIWRRLAARAAELDMGRESAVALIDEPDIRLVTQAGAEIRPTLFDGRVYAFVAPADTGALRLVSRASRPSDVIGPYLDDRRELGVLVGRIGLHDGSRRLAVDVHLSDAALNGWNAPEPGSTCRWTTGNAIVPLDFAALAGREIFLEVEVVSAGPYLASRKAACPANRAYAHAA